MPSIAKSRPRPSAIVIRRSSAAPKALTKLREQAVSLRKRSGEIAKKNEADLTVLVSAVALGMADRPGKDGSKPFLEKLPTVLNLDRKILYGGLAWFLTKDRRDSTSQTVANVARTAVAIGTYQSSVRGSLKTGSVSGMVEGMPGPASGSADRDIIGAVSEED